MDPDELKEG